MKKTQQKRRGGKTQKRRGGKTQKRRGEMKRKVMRGGTIERIETIYNIAELTSNYIVELKFKGETITIYKDIIYNSVILNGYGYFKDNKYVYFKANWDEQEESLKRCIYEITINKGLDPSKVKEDFTRDRDRDGDGDRGRYFESSKEEHEREEREKALVKDMEEIRFMRAHNAARIKTSSDWRMGSKR